MGRVSDKVVIITGQVRSAKRAWNFLPEVPWSLVWEDVKTFN